MNTRAWVLQTWISFVVSLAGSIVGIAKGAGMIEPNLATMLVYILTDLAVPRGELRLNRDHARL